MRIKLGLALGSSSHTCCNIGLQACLRVTVCEGVQRGKDGFGGWVSLGISSPTLFWGVSITAEVGEKQGYLEAWNSAGTILKVNQERAVGS